MTHGPAFDLAAPAPDGLLRKLSMRLRHFGEYIPVDVEARLHAAGVPLSTKDATALVTGLHVFEMRPELDTSVAQIRNEERIAELAEELVGLLKVALNQSGWRYVWGDELDPLQPEPDQVVEIPPLVESLMAVEQSARQRARHLRYGRESSLLPGSNRADPKRHLFWMLLLAFWTRRLGREIRTSNDDDHGPSGPLIAFIRAFSAGKMTETELSGDTIRQWIRRNADRAGEMKDFIPTW